MLFGCFYEIFADGIWMLFYFNYYELIYMKKENFMENNVTVNEYIYIYDY